MAKSPLYEIIFEKLKQKIISGELTAGKQLPTEMEIAGEFKVSRITATRALKELEQSNFIYRKKGSGSYVNSEELWERVFPPGKENNKLSIISLILPFSEDFSSDIFTGIEDVAKKYNYFVTFHNSADAPQIERDIIEETIKSGSDGFIIYPSMLPGNMDLYSRLLIEKFPFVLIDRKIPGIDTSLVWTDNKQGFFDITTHLLEQGHRKIIFAGTSVYSISSELDRYNGFCQAHLDYGIPLLKKNLYCEQDYSDIPSNYRPEEPERQRICNFFFDIIEDLPPTELPTAIAAVNDQVAEIIIRTAQSRGIRIPEKYSVTGFDNLPFSSQLPVPLTTVAQHPYDIGRLAAEELFHRITYPARKTTVQTVKSSIILRESTKPAVEDQGD